MIPINLINKICLYNSHPVADLLRPFFQHIEVESVISIFLRNGKFSWTNMYNIHTYNKYGMKYRNVMYQLLVLHRFKTKWKKQF